MVEPITIAIIVWNVLSFILHAYHIKHSQCMFNKCGLSCDCLASPRNDVEDD